MQRNNPAVNKRKKSDKNRLHPLFAVFYLIISPLAGWKKIKGNPATPETFAQKMFYPLIALCSALSFYGMIFNPELSVSSALQKAVIIFMTWFISYFIITLSVKITIGKEATPFIKKFVMSSLSTLIFFYIIYELIPQIEPLIVFTPLYTMYIIFRGAKYIGLEKGKETQSIVALCALILGIPLFLSWIFVKMMPGI